MSCLLSDSEFRVSRFCARHEQALLLRNPGMPERAPRSKSSRPPIASWRRNSIPTAIRATTTANIKFKEINEAYDVLKDDQKRAAYDRFGHAAFENGGGRSRKRLRLRFRVVLHRCVRRSVRRVHGRAARAPAKPRRRSALQSGDHAGRSLRGQGRGNPRQHGGACEACAGSRRGSRARKPENLPDLRGPRQGARAPGLLHHRAQLPACRGTGNIIRNPCKTCRGAGMCRRNAR